MRQRVDFDPGTAPGNLRNQLYAWSRRHNIVFGEGEGLSIYFGRESDLTVFLLTWDDGVAVPRVH